MCRRGLVTASYKVRCVVVRSKLEGCFGVIQTGNRARGASECRIIPD